MNVFAKRLACGKKDENEIMKKVLKFKLQGVCMSSPKEMACWRAHEILNLFYNLIFMLMDGNFNLSNSVLLFNISKKLIDFKHSKPGSVARCNFSCNFQHNSAFKTCKLVKTV